MWRAEVRVQQQKLQQAFASQQLANGANEFANSRTSYEPHNTAAEASEDVRQKLAKGRQVANSQLLQAAHLSCNFSGSSKPGMPQPIPPAVQQAGHHRNDEPTGISYEAWRMQHPCALTHLEEIRTKLAGKRLAMFLDYDGTLTPIVSNPDEALLSPQMREVVRNLAKLFPTAIISGRGREKVENFVQLKELYYAGSHGMDIAGPTMPDSDSQADMTFQPAAHFKPLIDKVFKELCEKLSSIPGSSVEHNTFCVSAHFRNCSSDRWQDVVTVVEHLVAQNSELRMTRGRKVVEIRPKVNWHKGTALEHLLSVLGLKHASDVTSIYIGDDHTDEDAFRVLKESGRGFGVLVSTKVRDTTAAYTVRDPFEVGLLLQALVQYGTSHYNGWHSYNSSRTQQHAQQSPYGQQQGQFSRALRTSSETAGMHAVTVTNGIQNHSQLQGIPIPPSIQQQVQLQKPSTIQGTWSASSAHGQMCNSTSVVSCHVNPTASTWAGSSRSSTERTQSSDTSGGTVNSLSTRMSDGLTSSAVAAAAAFR